ncbi:MAG: pro-sigmaK processing inhibitor BofA family protein [Clostridia bacterium]|nr:pro-sigmaK processing inhibitor BofA family protein [Clostridia bacterium]MBR6646236.1 pro-sigmaK processing inhibitor BofA family protein [Clostridia bacterium]
MTFWEISAYIILAVIILIICRIFIKPLKSILWLLTNSALGWAGLMIFNSALAFSGFSIATNIVTASLCGILGLPGLILTIILTFMFK